MASRVAPFEPTQPQPIAPLSFLTPIRTGLRWIRHPLLRRVEWQNHPRYWSARKFVAALQFRCRRQLFQTKSGLRDLGEKRSAFQAVFRAIVGQVLLALLMAGALVVLDRVFPLAAWLGVHPKAESTLTLVSSLAQMSGTMLGLYFAAVSLVASTSYDRVSGEVRALVVGEEVGTFYFGFLAQFAALTILLTAFHALGLNLGLWCIAASVFVAVFGVFSFVVLGLRTFAFFDPTTLVSALNKSLALCMRDATPVGYRWEDPSFQTFHQKRAMVILQCYGSVVTLAEQAENLNGAALPALGRGLTGILRYYGSMKSQIPSASHWFRRRPRHKDWLTDAHSELEVARATDTALPPEFIPDHGWIEQEVGALLGRIAGGLFKRTDLSDAATFLNDVQECLGVLGRRLQLKEAIAVSRLLGRELADAFEASRFEAAPPEALEQSTLRMALYDLQGLGLISILLGLTHTLRSHDAKSATENVTKVNWSEEASLYRTGSHPRAVLEQWEELRKLLQFEIAVEGRIVSPSWVIFEMTAYGYAQSLTEVEEVLTECERFFSGEVRARIAAKDPVSAAQIGLRGMEAANKLSAHFAAIRQWHEDCAKLDRSRDRNWPAMKWDVCTDRIAALRKDVVANVAICIPALRSLPESEVLPDLFGQAYSVLAEACFAAIVGQDEAAFAVLFPVFFGAALHAHDRVVERQKGRSRGLFKLAMGPCGDLLAISGYAILTSEIDGKGFAGIATSKWDEYFTAVNDATKVRGLIETFAAGTDILAGMSPRELLRYQWSNAYRNFLLEKGFKVGRGLYAGDIPDRSHPSHILRAFVVRSDFLCDAEDVFLAIHLFKRPEAQGLEMPDQVESFADGVEAETTAKDEA